MYFLRGILCFKAATKIRLKDYIYFRAFEHREAKQLALRFRSDTTLYRLLIREPWIHFSKTYNCLYMLDESENISRLREVLKGSRFALKMDQKPDEIDHTKQGSHSKKAIAEDQPKDPIKARRLIHPSVFDELEKFRKYLKSLRYSQQTIKSYLNVLQLQFSTYDKQSTSALTMDDLDQFNHDYFISQKHSRSYQNIWISALKLFLDKRTDHKVDLDRLERPKQAEYLPVVLSIKEVKRMITGFKNLKHRTILLTIYACGMRKGELLHLKLTHLDFDRGVIRIRQSKGAKDRDVPMPGHLSQYLNVYIKTYQPKIYVFNGMNRLQYSASSIDNLIKQGAKRAGIQKRVTCHTLRHSLCDAFA